jgi:PPM family protein phosphatase
MRWLARWMHRAPARVPELTPGPLDARVAVMSDIGCVRKVNQDCGRYLKPVDQAAIEAKGTLIVVADGMGGHAAGEVASRLAVDTISGRYYEREEEPAAALVNAIHDANAAIYSGAARDAACAGMGTTCVVLVIRGREALAAHVGDSRLYLVRDGRVYLMTEDHSAVMDLVRRGLLTLEAARHHAEKNVLLRALGIRSSVEVSVWREAMPVRTGDIFLLCSDGLHDLVSDEEMGEHALAAAPRAACENLIALAKQRGGYDNITVGIVRLDFADREAAGAVPRTREAKVMS